MSEEREIAYTSGLTVCRGEGDLPLRVHVDPGGAMSAGQVYDAELVMPATGRPDAGMPARVDGVARGTASTVGCALPQLPAHHCVAVHVCALRVTIRRPNSVEEGTVHLLPVEVHQRDAPDADKS